MLAKHQRTFRALQGFGKVDKFPGPLRDPCSTFITKRTSGSVSTTVNVSITSTLGKRGSERIVTIVNSKTVANKLTFRNLGGTSTGPGGLLVVLGSGSVTVSRTINKLDRCLISVAADRTCGGVHCSICHKLQGVGLVGGSHQKGVLHFGGDLGTLLARRRGLFRKFDVHCFNPVSKRSINCVVGILGSVGSVRNPGLLRVGAGGNGKFGPTRGSTAR